jgi:starch-binding outer membrane protein, SusD/RagB family
VLSLLAAASGCGGILDVENPNNLIEDELTNPAAAEPIVRGAAGTVARGIGAMLGVYSTATDEVIWIGSRDAWRELDQGFIANERNEFTDDAYRFFAQGRFMADEAVARLEGFDADRRLLNRNLLAEAYLHAAVAYVTAADMYETFVISNRREAGAPIPRQQMGQLYDRSVDYATKGLAIATTTTDLRRNLLGVRARAHFSKGVWGKIVPAVAADPLVSVAAASADAQAALAIMPADYRYRMTLSNDDLALAGEASLSYNLYQRGELNIAPEYGTRTGITNLRDPITGAVDVALEREIRALNAAFINQPITIVSAREMHLILAEAALAQGNTAAFTTSVNNLRALDGVTAYAGQIPAPAMLAHARRVNLFLQGRRLADHYRFRQPSAQWIANSTAVQRPGTLLPVTCIEIRAQPQNFPGVSC